MHTLKHYLFILLAITTTLQAIDLDINMGTGFYYTGADGRIEYTDEGFAGSYSEVDLVSSGQFYIWGDFKSAISYLPILRLQYLKIIAEGDSKLHLEMDTSGFAPEVQQFIDLFNDQYWESALSHNIYDVYLYYEFFEETPYPSLGIGGGLKSFDYAYNVALVLPLHIGDRDSESVPMVFLHSRYELPSLQLGFESESEIYIFGASRLYDVRAKMDLLFDIDESTKMGLEMGYRESFYDLRGSDVESVKADMSYSGLYVGVMATFK